MAKKAKKAKTSSSNPLLEQQLTYLQTLTENERNNFFSNDLVDPERRAQIWMDQADLGSNLVDQCSWATPDERALRILKKFSPIVEVGCGANAYWCRAMKAAGVDVIGYDMKPKEGGKIETSNHNNVDPRINNFTVMTGGPEVLAKEHLKNRTLFLCYPDEETLETTDDDDEDDEDKEAQSLGSACLEHFQGKYVIHVGELYGETLSMDQAPWGRSSGPEFQQRLASEYHCLLKAKLTNWLHVRDTISVWKRSEICPIVFDAEGEDDDEEEVEYRHIPKDEILPLDLAAPCLSYLLENDNFIANHAQQAKVQDIKEEKQVVKNNSMGIPDKDSVPQQDKSSLRDQDRKAAVMQTTTTVKDASMKPREPASDKTKPSEHHMTAEAMNAETSGQAPQNKKKKKKKKKRKRNDSVESAESKESPPKGEVCPW